MSSQPFGRWSHHRMLAVTLPLPQPSGVHILTAPEEIQQATRRAALADFREADHLLARARRLSKPVLPRAGSDS